MLPTGKKFAGKKTPRDTNINIMSTAPFDKLIDNLTLILLLPFGTNVSIDGRLKKPAMFFCRLYLALCPRIHRGKKVVNVL